MGSSDERNSKAIDASVGGLVWVRRRNGSWWPGRIMAHHEVPDDTIVSPKSGTPIKLLGREDAGVDWYNLEKSKRVKAFRCGEYDACIETAKATATGASKKPVKYARREDAIVHALEIENALLVGKDEKASTSSDSTEGALQSSVSCEKTSNGESSKVLPLSGKRSKTTPSDSEDDGSAGNKRMRGLEDLGVSIGSNGEANKQENDEEDISDSMPNGVLANGTSRGSSPSMKGIKRSPVVNANENSKKKNQRPRPPAKVLESTATASVPVSENKVSAVINNNNSDSNGVSCENDDVTLNASQVMMHNKAKETEISSISVSAKDEVFDVPLLGEEKHSAGTSEAAFTFSHTKALALVSEPTRQCDDVVKTEGCNGFACISPSALLINGIEDITSKWQIKGKRNPRQMSKKQEERRLAYAEEANNNSLPHCSLSDQNPHGVHFSGMGRNSQLYDVKIEEKGSYKPRNVPMISLMSKLDGEAIVGHPLTLEVLQDGSCDRILCSHIKSLVVPMVAGDAKPKPSWKNKSKKKKPHIPPHKSSKSKKASSLSIKTRCLSALSGKKLTVSSKKKVMIEKTREGIVSCIPLKVVFSRINEAVKGSARQVHRALPSSGNNTT
ncbi:hypothetical protein HID58_067373 [Brassica napus]|uniref:BnaCnng31400D protein n=2 Tax=Brassica napus TaxID=3708 RepID=A0A078IY38_BRANA|nr:uncharacterized protein At1g51745 [Brassica napus]KAH0879979.1 hypothetical protein HID58_067373 [Brassica napus]CAF1931592.1 unnamed protein product [Brassica napus]CDY56919.1 BnaCnng31400D [Brassica napus]